MSTLTPAVDGLLATADREWRTLGINRRDRVTLAADLRGELEAAAADGFDPAELLGSDPAGFAHRIAEEAGVERTPPRYGQILGAATVGGVVSFILGWALVLGLHEVFTTAFDLSPEARERMPVWLGPAALYGLVVAAVVAGAIRAVRVAQRDVPRVQHTAARMALLLPPALVVSSAAASAVGWVLGYSFNPLVIGVEVAIVLAGFLAATTLARYWTVTAPGNPATELAPALREPSAAG
ncbi:hypothetical protein [Salinispora oceanensis]|uniref:hypothetical protein n=1 Tax=Salinispora oceanensis TaxID=1050199 RepID=UPI0003753AE7|nr:hypothetical protein [Salinispora oceanensis]